MYAVIGILAALHYRNMTGKGQYLEISLFEGQVSWMTYQAANYFATGKSPGRLGTAHPNIVPYQAFETKTGYMVVVVGNDKLFRIFCEVLNLPSLSSDPKFETNADRVKNREELTVILEKKIKTESKEYW